VDRGIIFAVPFDLERLEARGTATALEGVSSNPNLGSAQLDFSRSGTLAYRAGGTEGLSIIQWLDSVGKTVSLGNEPATHYINLRLSPEGNRLVCSTMQATDLWIYDWQRDLKTRLSNGFVAGYPYVSPGWAYVFGLDQP
jgi:hypothetical protein